MPKKKRGIYAEAQGTPNNQLEDKVADFAYENDSLADLIVAAWTDTIVRDKLVGTTLSMTQRKDNAKAALAARGIHLLQPIVITETEYENGFNLADAGLSRTEGVVFVLPRKDRAVTAAGTPLLETAKMLMAITPNGI